jgi:hypothetical protein
VSLQVAQLQADVGHYQGQAETALRDSEGWQQTVQELRTELAEKAVRAPEFGDMQAEAAFCPPIDWHILPTSAI